MNQIALVTCLFNPCGYLSRYANYQRFAERVRRLGILLYCVELTFCNQKPKCRADVKIDLSGNERHFLWQKEALLNIGLDAAIGEGREIICWIDADAYLPKRWPELAASAVDVEGVRITHIGHQIQSEFADNTVVRFRSATTYLDQPFSYAGHPGGGWLAHHTFWKSHQLFPYCIVGGGDWATFCGFVARASGKVVSPSIDWTSEHQTLRLLWNDWVQKQPLPIQVGALPCTVRLLAHGRYANRQYRDRQKILRDFKPSDVRHRQDGVLEWATDKPLLHAAVRDYFTCRSEDE